VSCCEDAANSSRSVITSLYFFLRLCAQQKTEIAVRAVYRAPRRRLWPARVGMSVSASRHFVQSPVPVLRTTPGVDPRCYSNDLGVDLANWAP